MKSRMMFAIVLLLAVMSVPAVCTADTIYGWTDNVKYWPGYESPQASDNAADYIGQPRISGGTIVVDDQHFVTAITAQYNIQPGWTLSLIKPGDLFINNDGKAGWDYVMSMYNNNDDADEVNKYKPVITDLNQVPIYETTGDESYLITRASESGGYWGTHNIRNSHPFAYTGLTEEPEGYGAILGGNKDSNFITYSIPTGIISYRGGFSFSFTQSCANDVVLVTTPVPEPSTLLLLGLGLGVLGLAGAKRSK
jgi:hypothetical protein